MIFKNTTPLKAMMMAMDRNRLIGKDNGLPWHVPGELAYFKQVTLGKPIIMGRKTFDSIGRALPGRTNIVVTRNREWHAEDVEVCYDLPMAWQRAMAVCAEPDTAASEVVVIGGAGLCREAMADTQRLYLTVIDDVFEGDTWLDSFDWDDWQRVSESVQDPATTGGLAVTYWVLEKNVD